MFLFRSQLREGLPLTVFRFRPERTLLGLRGFAPAPHQRRGGVALWILRRRAGNSVTTRKGWWPAC